MQHDANYFKMPPFALRHGFFVTVFTLAIGVLYAEPAWLCFRLMSLPLSFFKLGLIGLISAAGYGLSFYLPPIAFNESRLRSKEQGGMVPFLAMQWAIAVLCIALSTFGCFYLTQSIGNVSGLPAYRLLSWFFLMGLFGSVVIHGLVTYIRYVEYLYVRKEDQPIKILTITVSAGVFLLALCLTLFLRDTAGLKQVGIFDNADLWGLHVYFRGLYWIMLCLWIYVWHIVCLADH